MARQRLLNDRLRQAINGRLIHSLGRRALVVGLLGPLPLLIGLLAVSYLIPVVGVDAIAWLPVIVIGLVLWAGLTSKTAAIVARQLDTAGANPLSFAGFWLGCLALMSKPLYDYLKIDNHTIVAQLPFCGIVLGLSVVLAWTFLQLTVNQSLSSPKRLVLTLALVVVSLAVPVTYLLLEQLG